jgi:hypothetical protein
MTDRLVRIVGASPPLKEGGTRTLFSEFQEFSNVVLLGDPGAGKSHLFNYFADREAGRFLSVRSFLNIPTEAGARMLFIDALDERRSGRGDHAIIDALVQRLFSVNPAKVRISCRAQDWLGETDLATLRDYFDVNGGYVVLALDELTIEERDAIIIKEGFDSPATFTADAGSRYLDYLLTNPQNLIMLCRVVKAGGWPRTRTDLFHRMTQLLLTEHNDKKTHAGEGVFCADELRDAAGAVCAARLISDVAAVTRAEASGDAEMPSYRTLDCENIERVRATLGRRVFVSVSGSDAVDYVHRTIAEFLAACWVAKRVRGGLPIGRVRALIGIDGHPTPELRGLHAWLAVLLPEHAEILVAADPYGVLTYGDAASLSLSLRHHLLSALGKLSETDPWFRSGSWSLPALGALATPDVAVEFGRVLQSKTPNFAHRSCVLEAVARGVPLPQLQPELMTILIDGAAPSAERSYALDALVKLGPDAEASIVRAYGNNIGNDADSLRLRAEILAKLYAAHFEPEDVAAFLAESLRSGEDAHVGPLWRIAKEISLRDVIAILDAIPQMVRDQQSSPEHQNTFDILHLLDELLTRALKESPEELNGYRVWPWLRARRRLRRDGGTGSSRDGLKEALAQRKHILLETVAAAVDALIIDDHRWRFVQLLREATMHLIDEHDLLDQLVNCVVANDADRAKQSFLYQLSLLLSFRPTERALAVLTRLHDIATGRPDLQEILSRSLSCPREAWREEDAQRRAQGVAKKQEARAKNLREFTQSRNAIHRGAHYGWMAWLAELYLGWSNDRSLSPRERIAAQLGEENAQVALDGLVAVAFRDDLPSLREIIRTLEEDKYYKWWIAIIAGLDEASNRQLDTAKIATSTLQAALVIGEERNILGGERDQHRTWKRVFLEQHPHLAKDAYIALARSYIARGKAHVEGLHPLLNDPCLGGFRKDVSLQLLGEFPNTSYSVLDDLIEAALATPESYAELLRLSDEVLHGNVQISTENRRLWLVAAYLLDPIRYAREMSATNDSEMVWRLRDLSGSDHRRRQKGGFPLSVSQLSFIAGFTARHFPDTDHPKGGWEGSQNPWDGADYVRSLINQASTVPTAEGTEALEALAKTAALDSYADHIKHALANQRARRRDAEYRQPDWSQTVQALKNAAPAGPSDLHALLTAHLNDAKARIGGSNTDIFKRFWNEDSHGRITEPKVEGSCRDALIDALKPGLMPQGVALEPEGHMVADKRADMVAMAPGMKVVAELKRDTHADVWTALEGQLDRLYTRDPEAAGYGIYVVFWYGEKRKGSVPAGPGGRTPTSAADMDDMLRKSVPEAKKDRIAAIVLDVSDD